MHLSLCPVDLKWMALGIYLWMIYTHLPLFSFSVGSFLYALYYEKELIPGFPYPPDLTRMNIRMCAVDQWLQKISKFALS